MHLFLKVKQIFKSKGFTNERLFVKAKIVQNKRLYVKKLLFIKQKYVLKMFKAIKGQQWADFVCIPFFLVFAFYLDF